MSLTTATAAGLCTFVDASPSPFHVTASVGARLEAEGFTRLAETDAWPSAPGRFYVVRGGSVIAWSTETEAADPAHPFRIVGGHTDSPNLRPKQHPDLAVAGWEVLGLEPYGGALLPTWLDRDLGLSGRLSVRDGARSREVLVRLDEPVLRVPSLAIHLSEDRKGISPDPQRHLNAVWGLGSAPSSFLDVLAAAHDLDPADVLGWELMTHVLEPAALIGADGALVSSPRLDNQGTCYAGTEALLGAVRAGVGAGPMPVLVLFDHEEVGSMSDRGAMSDLLLTVLERVVLGRGGDRDAFLRAVAGSVVASGDMAHATHPNQPERHEPAHRIVPGGGPVLKVNQNLRYSTDAAGAGVFALACAQAGVPLQRYVHRADLPCGTTIGPITASRTGITTVDVGAAQLSMHSARELMAAADVPLYAEALAAFLRPQG